MNTKWILFLLLCTILRPEPALSISIMDSSTFSSAQISNLQALQAPGQIPVGTVIPWPSDKRIPEPMWLPCNGQYIASGSPLSNAIGGNVIPDLNGVKDTVNSNGNGLFIRGGAIAQVTSTDSIRYQYHGQDTHTHQASLYVDNPNVSGKADGQLYYDWLTGGASAASNNREDRANWKSYNGGGGFRKFQYNVDMGLVEGSISSEGRGEAWTNEHIRMAQKVPYNYYSAPGDPYTFTSNNLIGGYAFTIPKGEMVERTVRGWNGEATFRIGHEGVGEKNPRWTTSQMNFSRYLGAIGGKTLGGMIDPSDGGLIDTKVDGKDGLQAIVDGGDNDYEYTGDAETRPQYKNVVYIIKALP